MAEDQPKKRSIKKTETLRQKAERASTPAQPKTRRVRTTASKVSKPFRAAHRIGKKEYYLPLPTHNKFFRFLNKRRRVTPRFLINAWKEVRMVEWPTAHQTVRLTFAVFVFSILFGTVVTLVDTGLDKIFKQVFLK